MSFHIQDCKVCGVFYREQDWFLTSSLRRYNSTNTMSNETYAECIPAFDAPVKCTILYRSVCNATIFRQRLYPFAISGIVHVSLSSRRMPCFRGELHRKSARSRCGLIAPSIIKQHPRLLPAVVRPVSSIRSHSL